MRSHNQVAVSPDYLCQISGELESSSTIRIYAGIGEFSNKNFHESHTMNVNEYLVISASKKSRLELPFMYSCDKFQQRESKRHIVTKEATQKDIMN